MINVNQINMDSQRMVVSHVIVMKVDQKELNVTTMDNVHVMIMSKEYIVIDAKKINTTAIKDVWIAHTVTI